MGPIQGQKLTLVKAPIHEKLKHALPNLKLTALEGGLKMTFEEYCETRK